MEVQVLLYLTKKASSFNGLLCTTNLQKLQTVKRTFDIGATKLSNL
jgi:hypothetical protein